MRRPRSGNVIAPLIIVVYFKRFLWRSRMSPVGALKYINDTAKLVDPLRSLCLYQIIFIARRPKEDGGGGKV